MPQEISDFLALAREIDAAPRKSRQNTERVKGAQSALFSYWDFIKLVDFKGGQENFSGVHRDMIDFVSEPQLACVKSFAKAKIHTNKGRRRLVLVARGHLKSTICSVGYVLWRIYRNPNIRICVGTATKDLSTQFIKEIKQYLENEELQETVWNVRPHIAGRMVPILDKAGAKRRDQLRMYEDTEAEDKKIVWRSDAIQVIRSDIMREPTVLATSPGSNTTGMHFDLLIKDDIINDDTVSTIKKIDATLEWAQDLESVLDPQRKVLLQKAEDTKKELWEIVGDEDLVLGTRYARDDYYNYILENQETLEYKTFIRNVYKNGEDKKDGYTWSERFNDFTVENLKRRISPRRFASQYLNKIIAEEDQILKLSAIQILDPHWCEVLPSGRIRINMPTGAVDISVFIVVDPAISQKKTADNTVILAGGFDSDRNLYVIDSRWGKMLPETLIAQVYSIADKWKLHKVTIEVVAFQQVLVHMLRSSFARFRPIGIAEYRPRGEKKARIASMLEPYFSNRKIYVSKGLMGIPQFREEIEYFSNDPNSSMHDDFVDCMAILAEIATPSPQYKTPQRNRLVNMSVNERYGGIY